MPRSNSTRICTQTDIECTNDAEDNLTLLAINTNLTTDTVEGGKSHCSCLPACTSISYDVELSQADFDYKSLFRSFKDNISQFDTLELARTTIYFKEAQFTTSKRSDLYGWIDFMADCGGLLGKCDNFSFKKAVFKTFFSNFLQRFVPRLLNSVAGRNFLLLHSAPSLQFKAAEKKV